MEGLIPAFKIINENFAATQENLDGAKETGCYILRQATSVPKGMNDHGVMFVAKVMGGGCLQITYTIRNKIYMRYCNSSGTWSDVTEFTGNLFE